ncbi:hypothetical protein GQ600_12989 [Phytophthora cactorum]|nr:hypothetical protein GQ600_12989 [Phytophthora cactorum]
MKLQSLLPLMVTAIATVRPATQRISAELTPTPRVAQSSSTSPTLTRPIRLSSDACPEKCPMDSSPSRIRTGWNT